MTVINENCITMIKYMLNLIKCCNMTYRESDRYLTNNKMSI